MPADPGRRQRPAGADGDDPDEHRRFAARAEAIFTSQDAREGALAFAERRAPVWTGR